MLNFVTQFRLCNFLRADQNGMTGVNMYKYVDEGVRSGVGRLIALTVHAELDVPHS